ncbi:MAG: flagellar basal body rod protein FlgB [Acidimicrobiia bacterium]
MSVTPAVVTDVTMRTLRQAMQGVGARRQSIQDNLANVETPGYLANTVSFEDSLRQALAGGAPENMRTTTARSLAATNEAGNNVQVDQEVVALSENELRGALLTEALNAKYRLLRTSITGAP